MALTGDILNVLASHSRFVQRIRRRYEGHLAALPPGPPDRATMNHALQTLEPHFPALGDRLRVLRHLVMERLVVLDCEQNAPMEVVTHAMTHLAELVLDLACQDAMAQLDGTHGPPLKSDGQRAVFWVIGMGKLGARELNVSSDIDLIYVYDLAGETTGRADGGGRISHQEYFSRLVKVLYAMIGDTTEHGFVFRVDLALRPNGQSGPPVVSLGALEEYFQVQGREWERFAWLKSRVVAPADAVAQGNALRDVVLPFVFRRYLDYSVFESLRHLHRQIREHAARRSAGRPKRANDVKLSRGGIREIEFIVQLLQVVRGGQFPELSTRATLQALERLVRAQLMPPETADALARAYVFLRRVEHRIQYLDDQQTHVLPVEDPDLSWLALTLGYGDPSDFLADLNAHRERVALEFDQLLGQSGQAADGAECKGCRTRGADDDLELLIDELAPAFADKVRTWLDNPRVRALREEGRQRLTVLVQRTQSWLSAGRISEEAVLRWMDWVEPLLRRESYLALLVERPKVHEQLLRLLGAARWPARYLLLHPGVIDELASPGLLAERFDSLVFEQELEYRHRSLAEVGQDDEEGLLNVLRRAQHAEVFRTLARDVEGRLSVEQVADDLSALADSVLRVCLRWVWTRLKQKHREEPQVAIIGYGKLGGKELGYGGDLDIVFVYDDPHDQAGEIYAALVRKLINWLTVKTGEGDLYEIDTALRPNGNSGLLVTSFEAFAQYQTQRGSNTAWTWEHQAMTRARCCVAPEVLAHKLETVRREVVSAPRDANPLRDEIIAMRERMRAARLVPEGLFDVKHSPGGMVDAEFVVQHLVLAHACDHPELLDNVGNIALLHRCEQAGLLPQGVGLAAANAYRDLRRAQHGARLDEKPTQFAQAQFADQAQAIKALWQAVWP
ncbi:MAG: bifunctional [glutamate--ammonia ligase]-adenylyl-L-tyrosine phosphorylase/[glutamate--ammonia-ligase] adenylyltransferase [Alphaproteobacteria bacterium]|nr:bifunctional [glutamate--ammonia ligase]-adenylyl-L-tyrosine phosphorylase/[glutamate--ammonia-ligase] adenylyltransferase [Alphaproteobacteria bacterium]